MSPPSLGLGGSLFQVGSSGPVTFDLNWSASYDPCGGTMHYQVFCISTTDPEQCIDMNAQADAFFAGTRTSYPITIGQDSAIQITFSACASPPAPSDPNHRCAEFPSATFAGTPGGD